MSFRRNVRGSDAAIHEEVGARDVGRVAACEEERGLGHLCRLAEAADRHVHEAALLLLLIVEEVLQQRGVEWTRAKRVDADALATGQARIDGEQGASPRIQGRMVFDGLFGWMGIGFRNASVWSTIRSTNHSIHIFAKKFLD